MEELTKMVLDVREQSREGQQDGNVVGRTAVPLPTLAIPATLQDALMARWIGSGPAKEIAQLGATSAASSAMTSSTPSLRVDESTLQQG